MTTTLAPANTPDATVRALPEPAWSSIEPTAAVAVVMDFIGATLPQLDRFLSSRRLNPGGPGLPGSLFQWSRSTNDGVRVTEVWRSIDHFELFLRDILTPRLSEAGMPEPEVTTYAVHSYLTQGPPAGLDRVLERKADSGGTDQKGHLVQFQRLADLRPPAADLIDRQACRAMLVG